METQRALPPRLPGGDPVTSPERSPAIAASRSEELYPQLLADGRADRIKENKSIHPKSLICVHLRIKLFS
jgi:hypothetical protein